MREREDESGNNEKNGNESEIKVGVGGGVRMGMRMGARVGGDNRWWAMNVLNILLT